MAEMGRHEFIEYKGSADGTIVEAKGHRELKPTEAFVEIQACGGCGTDEHFQKIDMGLGHEGVGIVKELGSAASLVSELKVGDRVGMGWMQRFCVYCKPCLTGNQVHCLNAETFGIANFDQGCFGTGIAWDVSGLYKVPGGLATEDVGPLMCGVGVGKLGHFAIQFASKMGMEVVVFSSTPDKRDEAIKFGASEFVVTKGLTTFDKKFQKIDHLLITTSQLPDFALGVWIMAKYGKTYPLTISFDAATVPMLPMIKDGISIVGSAGAHRQSIVEMLSFAAKHGVSPKIQKFPMSRDGVAEAMEVPRSGKMRYRGVVVV